MMVSVKLMECFNNIVHTHVTYKSEIKNGIQFKVMIKNTKHIFSSYKLIILLFSFLKISNSKIFFQRLTYE